MRVIPTSAHAALDYIVGLALLMAPNLFGFADVGGTAVTIPRVIGAVVIGMSVLTRYELGLIKLIPMKTHLAFDYILMAILALSPWFFGFAGQPINVWLPHVLVGCLGLIIALMTETAPRARTIGPAH
jgi:hypothetical protein